MFTQASRRTLTAAATALTLAAGLAVGTASSASAEPAPAVAGTTTTITFKAPDQHANPALPISIRLDIASDGRPNSYDPDPDLGWITEVSGSISCEGGSWARLSTSPNPTSWRDLQAWTTLPASDSGKFCTLTLVDSLPGRSVFFPSNGTTVAYRGWGVFMYIDATVVTRSGNGGL
ncbi:hypothetical protein FB464_0893 [Subtercola boreus]|nr:hypothetical protein FB464_0893 [Subtercola boreus]